MAVRRTIIVRGIRGPTFAGHTSAVPKSWIVRVGGHEYTHGNEHALPFTLAEDAAQFVLDLRADYGDDAHVEVVGLDELGLPLDWFEQSFLESDDERPGWWSEEEPPAPELQTSWSEPRSR